MLSSFHRSTSTASTSEPMEVDGCSMMAAQRSGGEDLLRNMESLHLDGGSSPTDAQSPDNTAVLPLNDPVTTRNRQLAAIGSSTGRRCGSRKERDSEYAQVRRQIVMPYVLSGYVQLALNVAVGIFWLYMLYSLANTISSDINEKMSIYSDEVMDQISQCSRDYRENRCDPSTRVPAVEQACRMWEQCMARDPVLVAKRSNFTMETLGESLNGFFEKLTWKTIACLMLLCFGLVISYNAAFWLTSKSGENSRATVPRELLRELRQAKRAVYSSSEDDVDDDDAFSDRPVHRRSGSRAPLFT
ncbi:hypothetical protein FOZ60_012033 [Perkinsus olseni]|uniref:Brl1/Brr6 domain-containing protein n=1 Tax=Perkinsus olseni TaxID=32597 RepID=A0A7J6PAF6_PEROL|nr:hypothetical protein FOZ60_012033 [Perkinsus olseni]